MTFKLRMLGRRFSGRSRWVGRLKRLIGRRGCGEGFLVIGEKHLKKMLGETFGLLIEQVNRERPRSLSYRALILTSSSIRLSMFEEF
jgi:hypothetical protein